MDFSKCHWKGKECKILKRECGKDCTFHETTEQYMERMKRYAEKHGDDKLHGWLQSEVDRLLELRAKGEAFHKIAIELKKPRDEVRWLYHKLQKESI